MAEERDEEKFGGTEGNSGPRTTGQQDQQKSGLGQPQGQNPTAQSGQPIGGSDSSTGSGTPLSQGSESGAPSGGQGSSGQAQPGTGFDTLTQGGTGGSGDGTSSGFTGSGGSGGSTGDGFIGSQGGGSDEYLQQDNQTGQTGSSSAAATGGTDFAEKGQGKAEGEDDTGSDTPGSGGGGSI